MTRIFGSQEHDVPYSERRAAYVVIRDGDFIATVRPHQKHFLPGGGSLPFEAPDDTIIREVREELARGVRLTRKLGEAIQYFYSDADQLHYRMHATFFAGEFTDETRGTGGGVGENELHWLPSADAERACFHACHAWAVRAARELE